MIVPSTIKPTSDRARDEVTKCPMYTGNNYLALDLNKILISENPFFRYVMRVTKFLCSIRS
jgi:hypothetical protein